MWAEGVSICQAKKEKTAWLSQSFSSVNPQLKQQWREIKGHRKVMQQRH